MHNLADHIAHTFKPKCPHCGHTMRASVLSGGSDPEGHTDKYRCTWKSCERMEIQITISIRDPDKNLINEDLYPDAQEEK